MALAKKADTKKKNTVKKVKVVSPAATGAKRRKGILLGKSGKTGG